MRNEAQFYETRSSIEARSRGNLAINTSSSAEKVEKAVHRRTVDLLKINAALQKKINEHKIIESTLRLRAARLQQIVNGTTDGILILNRESADSAKKRGEGGYEVFKTDISACVVPKFRLESELKQALDRQEFVLHYQPIIDLRSQKITGFEALLRWIHPERGLIAPDDFIPLAEETGLIIPIGAWVLSEACSQLKTWQREIASDLPLSMSVNVSSLQLKHPGFLAMVEQTLMTTQIQASHLTLEITESVMMEESALMGDLLGQLRAQNIQLSLDDFGTGYSSLVALKQFPISALKLDRSFTKDLGNDPKSLEIVQAVMHLAQKMNMNVIAEGIETASQQSHLQTLDCVLGQGFLFSAAIDGPAAGRLIEANARLPQWVM